MENHPHPRAILHLEFGRDGSVESWPRGDLFYLRESMRTLAGALLTEPATLDQVTGAAGIGVDPSSLWITPPLLAQSLCESNEAPKQRAFRRGIAALQNAADYIFTPARAILAGLLAGFLRGFIGMVELHERETQEEAAR